MNKRLIRYDEVILWKAEVLIQLDRQDEALPLINKIRQRAANSLENLKTFFKLPYINSVQVVHKQFTDKFLQTNKNEELKKND